MSKHNFIGIFSLIWLLFIPVLLVAQTPVTNFIPYSEGGDSTLYRAVRNGRDVIFFSFEAYNSTGVLKSYNHDSGITSTIQTYPNSGQTPQELTPYKGYVYFTVKNADGNNEYYRTNGRAGSVERFPDFISSEPTFIDNLTTANGYLFIQAHIDGVIKLYSYDGVDLELLTSLDNSEGIKHLDIYDGGISGLDNYYTYFYSDGTVAGTKVYPLNEYVSDHLTVADETYFIGVNVVTYECELWHLEHADFTLSKIVGLGSFYGATTPILVANVDGIVLFYNKQTATGAELWKSDGTKANTGMITDLNPGYTNGAAYASILDPTTKTLYLSADKGDTGFELFKTTPPFEAIELVADIYSGLVGSLPYDYYQSGERIYFSAELPDRGREIISFGADENVLFHGELVSGPENNTVTPLFLINNTLYITHYAQVTNLWRMDLGILGLRDNLPLSSIEVFPNPTASRISYSIPSDELTQSIKVVDIKGSPVSYQTKDESSIDVSGLPEGVYFLLIETDKNVYLSRFVKQ